MTGLEKIRKKNSRIWLSAVVLVLASCATVWSTFGCKGSNVAKFTSEGSPDPVVQPKPSQQGSLSLPVDFERWTGDLNGMVKRRRIRALVVHSKSAFFYDQGHPRGISYEALQEFEKFVNQKLKTGGLPVTVTFLPVSYEQLEQALTQGMGDLIAVPVVITPERQQKFDFSAPAATDVKQIVVTGPTGPKLASLEDLRGKEVYVNPLTVYYETLQKLNGSLQKAGKPQIIIKAADKNLGDEDLLEMVNAGLIPATVTNSLRAEFWSKVFVHLVIHPDCVLSTDGQVAWVMRKNSPEFKRVVDEFVEGHRVGTSFGNTLLRRYLKNTKWVKNSTSEAEMKKFTAYVAYFKKYAAQYDFDYLMLAAQAYQESLLDQSKKSPVGAVGIMQVMPKSAAAAPILMPDVLDAENNIHAGAKILRMMADTYFNDEKLDPLNKTLMTFAAYNAGPNRIIRLRKKAASEGLDPNQWFGNVELVVAKEVGQETVRYVSNIYKYYVSYKLALEQLQLREKAKH